MGIQTKSKSYEEFLKKFEVKKTTDDCFTPYQVYDVILDWVVDHYHVDHEKVVRPFYPGGDYEHYDYPEDAIVVDNPPFSIESKIIDFYLKHDIDFFLFAPSLTMFYSMAKHFNSITGIVISSNIEYTNGAKIRTGFITNLDPDNIIRVVPDLSDAIEKINATINPKKHVPRYTYPKNVVRVTDLFKICSNHQSITIPRSKAVFISKLDSQKKLHKGIFGGGTLVSSDVADDVSRLKHVADDVSRITWTLSDREKELVDELDRKDG